MRNRRETHVFADDGSSVRCVHCDSRAAGRWAALPCPAVTHRQTIDPNQEGARYDSQ